METGETVTPAGTPVADDLNRAGEACAACDRERDGYCRSSSRKADLGSAGTQRESGSRRGSAAADLAAARTGTPASQMNKVQKRETDTTRLQVERWGRIVWPLQDRACSGGTDSISQRQNVRQVTNGR